MLALTTLVIPSFIVIFWRKRPVLAFSLAGFIMLASVLLPTLVIAFSQIARSGEGDPQLISGMIAASITISLFCIIVFFPILAFIQWVARRKYVEQQKALQSTNAFE